MAEFLLDLIRANLAGGLAVLAVLALRAPIRRLLGPDAAYRLWAAPPLVVAASLLPAREILGAAARDDAPLWAVRLAPALFTAWALGALLMLLALALAQHAFVRAARAGRAGPAVVGVIVPRIFMPPNDGQFTEDERTLIRAHEREHLERGDPMANALMAALQCLLWGNPLTHLAVHVARLDQEIACDADVLRRRPKARALYARTLLKAQLATTLLPLGAHWAGHPLEARIRLLSQPQRADRPSGPVIAGLASVAAGALAWAMVPPVAPLRDHLDWRPVEPPQRAMSVIMIRVPAARHA